MTNLFKNLEFVHLRLKAIWQVDYLCRSWKSLKKQPRDVINMRETRGEVGKKTPKKRWIIPHFYDVTWLIFEWLSPSNLFILKQTSYFAPSLYGINRKDMYKASLKSKTHSDQHFLGSLAYYFILQDYILEATIRNFLICLWRIYKKILKG